VVYSGPFKDGKLNGMMTKTYKGNICEETNYIKGIQNGKTKIYGRDWIYEGSHKNDKLHGGGVLTFANGLKEDIEFKDGKAIDENSKKFHDMYVKSELNRACMHTNAT